MFNYHYKCINLRVSSFLCSHLQFFSRENQYVKICEMNISNGEDSLFGEKSNCCVSLEQLYTWLIYFNPLKTLMGPRVGPSQFLLLLEITVKLSMWVLLLYQKNTISLSLSHALFLTHTHTHTHIKWDFCFHNDSFWNKWWMVEDFSMKHL